VDDETAMSKEHAVPVIIIAEPLSSIHTVKAE
jgi:hypothetical protein